MGAPGLSKNGGPSLVGFRFDADDGHHSAVFVSQDVTVVDKVPRDLTAKIHAQFHAWIGPGTRPIRHLDRIVILAVVDMFTVALHHPEMDLMDMKFMDFESTVLNGPILDGALGGDDGGRVV